jgi:hypothetical protein
MKIQQAIIVASALAAASGCNGPMGFIPGGQMSGPEENVTSWEFAGRFENFELETRPDDPYSVRVNFVLRDGNLYVDPAEDRAWYTYLQESPAVRVRFAETIYPATAVPVTQREELAGFEPGRRVFRLDPVN